MQRGPQVAVWILLSVTPGDVGVSVGVRVRVRVGVEVAAGGVGVRVAVRVGVRVGVAVTGKVGPIVQDAIERRRRGRGALRRSLRDERRAGQEYARQCAADCDHVPTLPDSEVPAKAGFGG